MSSDRPIFLSIGYAACHWCHVMERESFEDAATAAQLNADFVAIKVDREERPDLDEVYMSAVQAMTGQGGWPMSLFLTPDGAPVLRRDVLPGSAAPRPAVVPRGPDGRGAAWRRPARRGRGGGQRGSSNRWRISTRWLEGTGAARLPDPTCSTAPSAALETDVRRGQRRLGRRARSSRTR